MEQVSPLSFSTKIQERDIIRFSFFNAYKNKVLLLITVCMVLAAGAEMIAGIKSGVDQMPFGPIIYTVVFVIVIPLSLYIKTKNNYKTNRFMQQEIFYTIGSEGIYVRTLSGQSSYHWSDIKDYHSAKKAIYLYLTSNSALLFPRDSVSNKTFERLHSILSDKRQKKKKKGSSKFSQVVFIVFLCLLLIGIVNYIFN